MKNNNMFIFNAFVCAFALVFGAQMPLQAKAKKVVPPKVFDVRTYDGADNNKKHPEWGKVGQAHGRQSAVIGVLARYVDGSVPDYPDFPNPRAASNFLADQDEEDEDIHNVSYMSIFWGQFLAHETTLTPTTQDELFPILIPDNDPNFTPAGTIDMTRSKYLPGTGTSIGNPRMQFNNTTPYLDGSVIYGSSKEKADSLRTFVDGKLKTSDGNLLPKNGDSFIAGDPRVNENIALAALQTIFMREHNRIADILHAKAPGWSDEMLYQATRKIVAAEFQAITINEYLSSLGVTLPSYKGYNQKVNSTFMNEFVTAVGRFGHSQSDDDEFILEKNGTSFELPLNSLIFTPSQYSISLMEGILRGAGHKISQKIDIKIVNAIREVTIPFPTDPLNLDLFAIDIQRGRDHGLPDYNTVRLSYGLKKVKNFTEITRDKVLQQKLKDLYGSVNKIDVFVGMLAEEHMKGKSVGPLLNKMLVEQMKAARDGDRYWYKNDPEFKGKGDLAKLGFDTKWIDNRLLSKIISDNSEVDMPEVPKKIFIGKELE